MNHSITAAIVAAVALAFSGAPASAGPCGREVAAFRQSLPKNTKTDPALIGTAPQSIDAQLSHQPTPASIAQAEQAAQSDLAKALARAKAFDAQGKEGKCRKELEKARLLANS
jgi:hypothetical protein